MSLVTRCTACGTLFKVVADQLKISEGWVRCGQCATVFDAQANLVKEPVVPAMTPQARQATTAPAPVSEPSESPEPFVDSITGRDLQAVISARNGASLLPAARSLSPSVSKTDASDLTSSVLPPVEGDFLPGTLRDPREVDSEAGVSTTSWANSDSATSQDSRPSSISVSAEPTTLQASSSSLPSDTLANAPAMPSFVAQAQRAARWRSPWMRLSLTFVLLALLTLLTLQIAMHEKDRLAAMRPDAKPWLSQLCEHMGCQVQALKKIESIAVDASSFNRINKNNPQLEAITQSYKLAVTLKNTGTLPVALPHVELSLQDAQDQAVLRRVLSPADLGVSLPTLLASQDVSGSLTLQIETAQLAGQRIAGYRVLAFYP